MSTSNKIIFYNGKIHHMKSQTPPAEAIAIKGDRIVSTGRNDKIKDLADDVIYIPKTLEMLTPILASVPLHLFAAYLGLELGLDIDKPRNLAKSVTVE